MREMKDSGIVYIGEIPTTWCVKKMKYVAKECSENGLMNPENSYYIGLENVVGYSNDIVATDTDYELSVQKRCHKDNVLFGKLRPYLSKVIIVPCDGFCTGEFLELTEYKGDVRFLRYSLLNANLIDAINMSTYGAKMPRANSGFILNCYITHPTYNEQKAIADFLDAKCAEIDALSADIQAEIGTLEEYKRSVITEKVTKGLNPNVEMKDSGIEWIGEMPKEWYVTKLKFLCVMQSGDNITAQDISAEKDETNCYEVYGANGFRGYYRNYTHNGKYCLVGRQGALAGNVHIVNNMFWATDHAVVVYVNSKVSQEYMYYLLISMNLNQYAFNTAAQPGLAVLKIMNLQMVCPPFQQQQIISDYLDKKCAEIDATIAEKKRQLEVLEQYKKSLIYEYVTGKKEVKSFVKNNVND